jgi:hypothetical protein
MPAKYSPEAIALCRKLYIQFGGNDKQIEKEMRKEYPSWSKQNLYAKGNGSDSRLGWIVEHGFEKSAQLDLQTKIGAIESDDERAYKTIVEIADKFRTAALSGDKEGANQYAKFITLQLEFRNKLDLSQSNFETFVEAWERITFWAKEIDMNLAKLFYKNKDAFIEKAKLHYGKTN